MARNVFLEFDFECKKNMYTLKESKFYAEYKSRFKNIFFNNIFVFGYVHAAFCTDTVYEMPFKNN